MRLAVVTACLPYVLMAMLVESLHGAQPSEFVAYASSAQTASIATAPVTPLTPSYACPVCGWLRVGTRQVEQTSLLGGVEAVPQLVVPDVPEWPDSPVPHPTGFRGPPSFA